MFSGELCTGECTCPNSAINLEGAEQLQRDRGDLHGNPNGPTNANCPCPGTAAFCNEDTCDVREADPS